MDEHTLDDDDAGEEGGGEWMATFADLSTLLLTFFVLLLSFSNMDIVEFREMLGSVKDAFGVQKQIQGPVEAISSSPVELSMDQNDGAGVAQTQLESEEGRDLFASIKKYIHEHGMEDDVELEDTPRGVIVRVKEHVLYQTGSAELRSDRAKELLSMIGQMQAKLADNMQIEGHTDNIPIKTRKYPSNWELSSARAISALRYLESHEEVSPASLGVVGYADSRPLASNDTPEGRERNRRVEFVFTRSPAQEAAAEGKGEGGAEGGGADPAGAPDPGGAADPPTPGTDAPKDSPTAADAAAAALAKDLAEAAAKADGSATEDGLPLTPAYPTFAVPMSGMAGD